MQRQSLGSPSPKAQIHGSGRVLDKEEKRKGGFSPEAELTASTFPVDAKTEKLIRAPSKSDTSIHLVPILVLLCFTVLYLCSHEPSLEDMVASGGFSSIANHKGVSVPNKVVGLALPSHRGLKEADRVRLRRMGPS